MAPDVLTLRLSCGCELSVNDDPTVPPWEVGEATFCDDDHHELADVVEVHRA